LPVARRQRRFGQSNMVVQAAIQGMGLALGREPLVADALAEGRLVRPFPETVASEYAYWIVCPPEAMAVERLTALRDWSFEAAEAQMLPDPT